MTLTDGSTFQGPGDANGYLGLAPYTGTDIVKKNMNFMQSLLKSGTISRNIFAMFLDFKKAKAK